jgi:hypothetical protein
MLVAAVTAVALCLPALAAAKGPASATLGGPGIRGAVVIRGDGEGGGGPLGTLVMEGGWFPLVFGGEPDPTTRTRPRGDLGPAYALRYVVPGPDVAAHRLVETVYPFAKPVPVLHMRAGQVVWSGQTTRGGWFVATPTVKAALRQAGLPATPPSGGGFFWSPGAFAAIAAGSLLVVLLVVGATLAVRRRERPIAAH